LACHAALDAASRICFSGILLEFIPMKIGAGMTNIVKGFMTHTTSFCSLTSPGQAWIPVLARLRAEALRRASTGMTGLGSQGI